MRRGFASRVFGASLTRASPARDPAPLVAAGSRTLVGSRLSRSLRRQREGDANDRAPAPGLDLESASELPDSAAHRLDADPGPLAPRRLRGHSTPFVFDPNRDRVVEPFDLDRG